VFGRARLWRAGVLWFAIGSILCAASPGLPWLIAARTVQAVAAAAATANSAPLLVAAYPGRRGRALGYGSVAIALGLVTGPPLGALLADFASWRLLFLVAVPPCVAAWMLARALPRASSPGAEQPIDWRGAVLSGLGLAGLLIGGTVGHSWGYASAGTLCALLA